MRLGAVQIFPRIFWNLFSFSSSYLYLLEGSKFFYELQILYLDC
jgi:hypothetical protein